MALKYQCSGENCDKPSTLHCPKCEKIDMPISYYCSQECFKKNWPNHKITHERHKNRSTFEPPTFGYTGILRPAYVSPKRPVPIHIKRPVYADTGIPSDEMTTNSHEMRILTSDEIKKMRISCKLAREVLDIAGNAVKPGISTEEIDSIVHDACIERNCYPSPLNYRKFPKSCCTSVNEVICHGIPDARTLVNGDIVNIDITVYHDGFHGDVNETFLVGDKVDENSKNLIKVAYESLFEAIKIVRPLTKIREIGGQIEPYVKKYHFNVTHGFTGHGINNLFHCSPNVPHYKHNKAIGVCKPGHTFTIEPMINDDATAEIIWPDNWTSVTIKGGRSAQFEHTLLVTNDGCEILTARTKKSVPFWWENEKKNDWVEVVKTESMSKLKI